MTCVTDILLRRMSFATHDEMQSACGVLVASPSIGEGEAPICRTHFKTTHATKEPAAKTERRIFLP